MIFVTVGTHEQQFNRLVKYMDKWAKKNSEKVVIQTGFSTYEPKNCQWKKLFAFNEMNEFVKKARIVITHGGPSSFIAPLQIGKIPVVIPRRKEFDEHVNNHQLSFCREVANRQKNIIEVEKMEELSDVIEKYDDIVAGMKCGLNSNNKKFCNEFEKIIEGMF